MHKFSTLMSASTFATGTPHPFYNCYETCPCKSSPRTHRNWEHGTKFVSYILLMKRISNKYILYTIPTTFCWFLYYLWHYNFLLGEHFFTVTQYTILKTVVRMSNEQRLFIKSALISSKIMLLVTARTTNILIFFWARKPCGNRSCST